LPAECPQIAPPKGAILKELRSLLEQRRYVELESRLEAYDRAHRENVACEAHAWHAYDDIGDEPRTHGWIDRWVEERPKSRAARIVRTVLHRNLAYKARGEKWAKDTSEANFAGMRTHFEQAAGDANASRELGPVHMVAAGAMVDIARGAGNVERARDWIDAVLKNDLLNYGIRRRWMDALEPRWGGTLEAMQELADESQIHAGRNPRLRVLLGCPDGYRGVLAEHADRHRDAIAHYSKALAYGDVGIDWSMGRARQYLKLHQYELGHVDAEYAKHWKPDSVDAWTINGRLFLGQEKWNEAIFEFNGALALEPHHAGNRTNRGWAHEKLAHWEAAEADYRAAIAIDKNAWRAAHLGIVLFRGLDRAEEAIPWLEFSATTSPRDAETWFQLAEAQERAGAPDAGTSFRQFLEVASPSESPDRLQKARRYAQPIR
jgi:tetratricopeptide (TPR) repeat protein